MCHDFSSLRPMHAARRLGSGCACMRPLLFACCRGDELEPLMRGVYRIGRACSAESPDVGVTIDRRTLACSFAVMSVKAAVELARRRCRLQNRICSIRGQGVFEDDGVPQSGKSSSLSNEAMLGSGVES